MSTTIRTGNSNPTSNDKVREFLQSKIQNLESKVVSLTQCSIEAGKQRELTFLTVIGDIVRNSLDILSTLYLEYSLISRGEESIVYAHRAISLNPNIQVPQKSSFLRDISGIKINNGNADQIITGIQRFYSLERTPGQMKVLESFLNMIKSEAQEKGEDALDFHESVYRIIKKGDIPDPHKYKSELSKLEDWELESEKQLTAKEEIGVGSFLKDMLLSREEDKRDRQRWKEGTRLPEVSFEQLQNIFSPNYPKHVIISEESLGGINLGHSRRFEHIDKICDAICLEVSKRIPRKLDAYRFKKGYTSDEIEIEGLGKIKINLYQDGKGIFTYISSIEGESFKIWNCRQSGRQYLNIFSDMAMPSEIKIKPLDLELKLYEDDLGIFITEKGVEYTNKRVTALGMGYEGDSRRDEIYKKGRKLGFSVLDDDARSKIAKIKPDKSWKKESKRIEDWLSTNVLEKIVATPEYKNQAKESPEAVAYPDSIGALYTWLSAKKAEKLEITNCNPSKVYPHEKAAVSPTWWLVPWEISGNFPEEAHNGFIWCGIGNAKPNSNSKEYMIPGHRMDSDFTDYHNKLVQINPKNGEDIFVVDYQAWDKYRSSAFKENLRGISKEIVKKKQLDEFVDRMYNLICDKPEDPIIFGEDRTKQAREMGWKLRLNGKQFNKMHKVLAKTLVPITEYKGNYQKPVVLISRDIGFDEVSLVHGVEYNPK